MKAAVQATLSRVPFGRAIHRKLQDVIGSSRLDAEADYARRATFLHRVLSFGLPIEGKSFLEVGTGWHPTLSIYLHLLGAARVITMDSNRWLTRSSLAETLGAVNDLAERFASDFHLSVDRCRAELHRLAERCDDRSISLQALLKEAAIEYHCPGDAANTGLPDNELDYVISTNVLEHLRPSLITAIFSESLRVLKPGAYALHHVDPGDHFSRGEPITTINFLRFSPRAWYYIGGSGLAYHNRLRCSDYVRLVERSGFGIVEESSEVDERALEALRTGEIKPHRTFGSYTNEELCRSRLVIFARTPLRDEAAAEH